MAKRLIGIDLDTASVRVVILHRVSKGKTTPVTMQKRDISGLDLQLTWIKELLGEELPGDRIAVGLPAGSAYVRWLEFPFRERRKIEEALPYELGAQLPVSIDQCVSSMYQLDSGTVPAHVCAAALPEQKIIALVGSFEQQGLTLNLVDLAPFCDIHVLPKRHTQALLLKVTEQQAVLARIENRLVTDFRMVGCSQTCDIPKLVQALLRDLPAIQTTRTLDLPLLLTGPGATNELCEALAPHITKVELLNLELGDKRIDTRFLPAAALALRAGQPKENGSFNFRRGPYACRGEWAGLKRALVTTGVLAVGTVVATAAAMTLGYLDRSSQVDLLRQELNQLYRQSFPQAETIVDIPLQMQSALQELRARHKMLGQSADPGPLEALDAISAMTGRLDFEVEDFHFEPGEARLHGKASSFETVNRLADGLKNAAPIAATKVMEAQLGVDGKTVDFRLLLTLQGGKAP
ncbi:MAG: hypothetical protein C0614_00775 [Desulfuromonas sp.]|nr:MAG: hypothetical protein C0614_00775 [Desulfuromonas sp.]